MDITTLLAGALPLILILTSFFTLLISLFLIYQYRRSVIRLMSQHAPKTSSPLPEQPDPEIIEEENPFPLEFIHISETTEKINPKSQELYIKLKRASWNNVVIYGLAGLGYALIMSLAVLVSSRIEILPFRFLTTIWIYLFPTLFTIYLVAIPERKTRLIIPLGYFSTYFIIIFLAAFPDWKAMAGVFILFFQFNLPPTLLILAFLNQHTKAVAPLIMAFVFFVVTGIILSLSYGLEPMAEIVKAFIYSTEIISPLALAPIISATLLILSGVLIMGIFGIFLLAWIKRQYQHKRINDQSLLIDAIWLVFAFYQPIRLIFENPWWILSGLVAFLVFKTITKVGFSITKEKATPAKIPQLLFLRVFSLGVKSQKIYNAITKFWRYTGNVLFITGPDLITSTVEPHDFLDFLSKKLSQRFIDSEKALNQQTRNIDTIPDIDNMYRIHDFFCYDNTWKMALSRLTKESEVIVMDLRSFSAQNAGCTFEINELINLVHLEQIIFIIDKTTDKNYMYQVMTEAWKTMESSSPNRSTAGNLKLFDYEKTKSGETQNLLQAITIATFPITGRCISSTS